MKRLFVLFAVVFASLSAIGQNQIFHDTSEASVGGMYVEDGKPTGVAVTINCFKSSHTCAEVRASDYASRGHVPMVITNTLAIVSWNDDGIIAASTRCPYMSGQLLMNFADGKVTVVQSSQTRCKNKDAFGGDTFTFVPEF